MKYSKIFLVTNLHDEKMNREFFSLLKKAGFTGFHFWNEDMFFFINLSMKTMSSASWVSIDPELRPANRTTLNVREVINHFDDLIIKANTQMWAKLESDKFAAKQEIGHNLSNLFDKKQA